MADCSITADIERPCKDLQGGVYQVFLFPFVKYSRSEITIIDNVVQTLPDTQFEVYSVNTNFTENTEDEGGSITWRQSFSLEIPKIDVTREIYKLVKQNYRAVFVDYNGNTRILGLWNGLKATITAETGTDKGSFSGSRVTFEGFEDNQALWYV